MRVAHERDLRVDFLEKELRFAFRPEAKLSLPRCASVELNALERRLDREGGRELIHADVSGKRRCGERDRRSCLGRLRLRREQKRRVKQVHPDVIGSFSGGVRHDDDGHFSRWHEPEVRAIAAGSTIVPHDRIRAGAEHDPVQSDLRTGIIRRLARLVCERHRALECAAFGMQIGVRELQHVDRRRADRARARECRQIPIGGDSATFIVTAREVRAHPGCEGNGGMRHAQRIPNALTHQCFVWLPGSERQDVAEEADAEVRVLELRTRIPRELVVGEEVVELRDGVVRVWIRMIRRIKVRRHARQSRVLLGERAERDLLSVVCREVHGGRKEFLRGIVEV
ncbi:MAG: hypothetical protein ABIQ10_01820 [Gemmatimonadaceae bacterium]